MIVPGFRSFGSFNQCFNQPAELELCVVKSIGAGRDSKRWFLLAAWQAMQFSSLIRTTPAVI